MGHRSRAALDSHLEKLKAATKGRLPTTTTTATTTDATTTTTTDATTTTTTDATTTTTTITTTCYTKGKEPRVMSGVDDSQSSRLG